MALPAIAAVGVRAIAGQVAKKAATKAATGAVAEGAAGSAAGATAGGASSGMSGAIMRSAKTFGRGLNFAEFGGGADSSAQPMQPMQSASPAGGQMYNTAQNMLGSSSPTTLDDNDQARFG